MSNNLGPYELNERTYADPEVVKYTVLRIQSAFADLVKLGKKRNNREVRRRLDALSVLFKHMSEEFQKETISSERVEGLAEDLADAFEKVPKSIKKINTVYTD